MLEKLNIHQKILGIMSELNYIEKGDKTVNGQYRFVSHDQVSARIHPLLVKNRVTVIPTCEEVTVEGNKTTVKVYVTFVNADDPSDKFTSTWYGQGIDPGDKGIGKAVSYAFKYAMLKTFILETGDDPDNTANPCYEPAKCLEFDSILPADMTVAEKSKLQKFLAYSSQTLKKHVEEVKAEAVLRPTAFLEALTKWKPKK